MIKVEMELRQAAAVRAALFETTKAFTYDEKPKKSFEGFKF